MVVSRSGTSGPSHKSPWDTNQANATGMRRFVRALHAHKVENLNNCCLRAVRGAEMPVRLCKSPLHMQEDILAFKPGTVIDLGPGVF